MITSQRSIAAGFVATWLEISSAISVRNINCSAAYVSLTLGIRMN